MKNYMKWLLGVTAFILLLLGATLTYTKLSLQYERERQAQQNASLAAKQQGEVSGQAAEQGKDTVQGTEQGAGQAAEQGRGAVQGTEQGATQDTEQAAEQTESAASEIIDFTMLNAEGETIAFSDLLGKPVILNFWATWCGPCQSEMPHIQEAYEQYGEDINFVLVNLTDGKRDTVDGAKAFVADAGYTFPIYFDTEMRGAYAYGAYSIPLTYFMDGKGNVVSGRLGAMTKEDLFEQIQLLTGDAGQTQ